MNPWKTILTFAVIALSVGCSAEADSPSEPAPPAPEAVVPVPEPPTEPIELNFREPIQVAELSVEVQDIMTSHMAEYTADPSMYPAGNEVTVFLDLNADGHGSESLTMTLVSEPYSNKQVVWWAGYKLELVDVVLSSTDVVSLRIWRIGAAKAPASTLTLARGETHELPGGVIMRFADLYPSQREARWGPSPLSVRIEYEAAERQIDHAVYELPGEEPRGWRWGNFEFTLTDTNYRNSLTLEVVELALAPLAATQK